MCNLKNFKETIPSIIYFSLFPLFSFINLFLGGFLPSSETSSYSSNFSYAYGRCFYHFISFIIENKLPYSICFRYLIVFVLSWILCFDTVCLIDLFRGYCFFLPSVFSPFLFFFFSSFLPFLFVYLFFETRSCSMTQPSLKLTMLFGPGIELVISWQRLLICYWLPRLLK